MSFTLCSSGAIIRRAGESANTTATTSGALLSEFCDEAEAFVCAEARYDLVTNSGAITTNGYKVIQNVVASHAAQQVINYDTGSYSPGQAELMLNVLENNIAKGIKLLKEDKNKTYLNIT